MSLKHACWSLVLLALLSLDLAGQTAGPKAAAPPAGPPRAVTPGAVRLEAGLQDLLIVAMFHLGKQFCEELKPFPVDERKLLIVELTVENHGSAAASLYLDQVWVHLDEENQRVAMSRAEEAGPRVYRPITQVLPPDPGDESPRVQMTSPGPVYKDGEIQVNPTGGGGVFVDLGKRNGPGSSPITLEKFVLTLFKKEFTATFLKAGQSASGFLYFTLPWGFDTLAGMQLHLTEIFGGTEDVVLALPAAPPAAPPPQPPAR